MPLRIEPVRTDRDLHRFVTFPFDLYRDDPHWVPPLIGDTKKLFDPEKNPFYEHGDMELWLAIQGDKVQGRIASIRNRRHEEFHHEAVGFFGFLETVDDTEVALGLLETAKDFSRRQGLKTMIGPVNPSTNDECGFPIDAFDQDPFIMMPHGKEYYDRLMHDCGLTKAKDLHAYRMSAEDGLPSVLSRGVKIAKKRNPSVTLRPLNKKKFRQEVEVFRTIYNAAWEKNWGFVPMTDKELDYMAEQLKQIIDPGLVQIAEKDGKPVGIALGLPDMNQALKHAGGKLFPFGLLKLLWYGRKVDRVRIAVLGLLEEHRKQGIDAMLYYELFQYGLEKGYREGEFSWILEDNAAMMRPIESFGGELYRTYRLYQASVEP